MREFFLIIIIGVPLLTPAAIIGTNSQARPLTRDRIANLPAKQQSEWKKYLERSERQLAADKLFLVTEIRRHGLTNSLPAPKGRKESQLSLREPTGWYGGDEARRIADVVVSFQTPAGGWCKGVDMTLSSRAPGGQFFGDFSVIRLTTPGGNARISDWNFIGTFDNSATTTQMRFLAKVVSATEPRHAKPYRTAFLHGMDYILSAQMPHGGWPQVWPLSGDYHDANTYNDGAMVNVLELLDDVAAGRDEFAFAPHSLRTQAAAAVEHGVDCILKTQVVLEGKRTLWCQQHDTLDLTPTAARNYEMPSLCSSESSGILLFLMKRPPTPAIIAAVHGGIASLEKTKIRDRAWQKIENEKRLVPSPGAELLWARFYDPASLRPIFGDRDKSIHDDVHEISVERRNGYSWFGVGPNRALQEYAHWRKSHPSPQTD